MSHRSLLGSLMLALGLLLLAAPSVQLNAGEPDGAPAEAGEGKDAEKEKKQQPRLKGSLVSATASQITILIPAKGEGEAEQKVIPLAADAVIKQGKDAIVITDVAAGSQLMLKLDDAGSAIEVKVVPAGEKKGEKGEKAAKPTKKGEAEGDDAAE